MQNPSNHDTVQSLRSTCLTALEAFVHQANATIEMFKEIQKTPVSFASRTSILRQRRTENDAFEEYHIARLALFRIAAEGPRPGFFCSASAGSIAHHMSVVVST